MEELVKFGIKMKIGRSLWKDLDSYSKLLDRPKTWIVKQALKSYLRSVPSADLVRILRKSKK